MTRRTPTSPSSPTRTLAGDGKARRGREREVVDAAAKVFARRGYAAATIQDVADELGILKGSLYYYIKTKEDLLFHLISEVHDEVDALRAEVEGASERDVLARLQLYVRLQTAYNLRNLTKISIYYDDLGQLGDERRTSVLERRKLHEDFLTSLVLEGQRQGAIDPARDPRLLVYSIFAAIIWPYRWYRPRGRTTVEDAVEACVDFVTHGVTGGAPG